MGKRTIKTFDHEGFNILNFAERENLTGILKVKTRGEFFWEQASEESFKFACFNP
jgi:hypothetical protein